ncbi:MAG: hypothetical protein AAGK30_04265 [Pseudomonadota bacterium]
MKRIIWMAIAVLTAAILYYVSRFWTYRLWPRDGLFGVEWLRPQGGLVGRWLRGTDLAPFELLIWAVGAFVLLTVLQKIYDLLHTPPE